MKKRSDPRHLKRIALMQKLFAWNLNSRTTTTQIQPIIKNLKKIDQLIAKTAPERPISQINRIDLSILRLSIFELIIKKEAPIKVVVDEAIELGKEYGGETSASFINGVLGHVIEEKKLING